MLNKRLLHRIGVLLLIALFVVGIARLFWLRFEAGDVYPPYSSLRSDPLGAQALYESLQDLGGQEISRNFRPLDQLNPAPGGTFVLCGLTHIPSTANDPWKTLLEKVTAGGGRLIISLSSDATAREREKNDTMAAKDAEDTNKENADKEDTGEDDLKEKPPETPSLGITLRGRSPGKNDGDRAIRQEARKSDGLPETLFFRSPLFFEPDDPAWETVFSFENKPVVVRRTWGEGDLVMIADSYLFSNEALRNHRAPEFLAWVIRDGPVVFDEYHHGLSRQPGISALMRKYRLHGVVLSLAVVVALLIWQRAVVFAPRPANDDEALEAASGADAAGGWVSLMRRHIAPGKLLAVCLEAWETSTAADRFPKEQARQIRDMISRQGENPVAVYQSICELLKRGKTP